MDRDQFDKIKESGVKIRCSCGAEVFSFDKPKDLRNESFDGLLEVICLDCNLSKDSLACSCGQRLIYNSENTEIFEPLAEVLDEFGGISVAFYISGKGNMQPFCVFDTVNMDKND